MNAPAIIMAAGEGARMLSDTPKPLHNVCGAPMIEHVLRALDELCPEKIVVTGQNGEKVEAACHGRALFARQDTDEKPGTAQAVEACRSLLAGRTGGVIVTSADKPLVLRETYARLLNEIESGAQAAVLTALPEKPFGYDRVIRHGGQVTAVVPEKDLNGGQFSITEVSAAVYAFSIEALFAALDQLPVPDGGERRLHDVIRLIAQNGGVVRAVPALETAECAGVNDRVQLARADEMMRRRINARHMRAGVTMIDPSRVYIQPDVMIGRDTVLHPGCEIGSGSVIGEGCILRANCQIVRSSIGAGAQLGNSLVKDSVIGAGARLEHAVIENAAVPDGAVLPPFTCLNRREE